MEDTNMGIHKQTCMKLHTQSVEMGNLLKKRPPFRSVLARGVSTSVKQIHNFFALP